MKRGLKWLAAERGNLVKQIRLRFAPAEKRKQAGEAARRRFFFHRHRGLRHELRKLDGLGTTVLLSLALGALFFTGFAAFAPALAPRGKSHPAVGEDFADGGEADGRSEVETCCSQSECYHPRTLNIEINHEHAGDEAADDAFNRNLMKPAPVPGQQAENRRQKDNRKQRSHPAQQRRAAGARVHPRPAHAAQPQRKQKRGEAEGLQQKIGEIGAEDSSPVTRRDEIRGRVERGIGGAIGGERQQEQQRNHYQDHPEKDVHGAAARGRKNDSDWLHDEGGAAARLPEGSNKDTPTGGAIVPEQHSLSVLARLVPEEMREGESRWQPPKRVPGYCMRPSAFRTPMQRMSPWS
jgi:hypothetical protein